jgi:hypothetical protein
MRWNLVGGNPEREIMPGRMVSGHLLTRRGREVHFHPHDHDDDGRESFGTRRLSSMTSTPQGHRENSAGPCPRRQGGDELVIATFLIELFEAGYFESLFSDILRPREN